MLARFQNLVHDYLPLTVAADDSEVGPRIGGMGPKDVVPRHINSRTRYFLTVPLSDAGDLDLSIYYSLDDDPFSPRSGLSTWRIIHPPTSDLVEAVVHKPQPRSHTECAVPSDLMPHALIIGASRPEPRDENELFSGYDGDKMGGIPRYDQNKDPIYSEARQLAQVGFVHFLQIDSYGPRGCPLNRSRLPFGNHVFHVWVRAYVSQEVEVRMGWA
jgi:hypothetical protein